MTPLPVQSANDPRWQRIEEAVCGAMDLLPDQRDAWLYRFCDGDAELRAEIDSLLRSQAGAEEFLEHSVAPYAGTLLQDEMNHPAPEKVGQYRIVREIGRGGMGVVYLAEREGQFKQQVGLKLVKRGLDTEEILHRFRNERQILASLNHPNIANLFDGGMTDDGLPYFVMEYVAGEPLTKYCERNNLSINDRLQLFRRACAAVQHAHQNLVVHRDLKPGNILVTNDRQVKLLDFGVAKLLATDLDDGTMTQAPQRVMTPQYASPEQIRGQRVTTATDVYSLGVVLYELLTGVKPYHLKDGSPEELSRAICETEPSKPSEAVREAETGRNGERENPAVAASSRPRVAASGLKGDLDNIVLMALRKEPERRYQSVEQFSEEIERHLRGLPVMARKDTLGYRTSKFITRNRLALTAAAIVLIAIAGGAILSLWQARVAARQRNQARQAQAKAEELNRFLKGILSSAAPEEKGKDAKVSDVLDDAAQRIDTEFANQPALKAQALFTIGGTYLRLGRDVEGERALRQAWELDKSLYGSESSEAATAAIQLSAALMNRNEMKEAQALLESSIATERKINGGTSPTAEDTKQLAGALANLGELFVRQMDHERAKPLLQESLAFYDRLEGPNNEDSALVLVSLGRASQFSGDLKGAEAMYRKSVETYRHLPARFAARLATTLLNLGSVLTAKGSFDEGVSVMREAHDIFAKHALMFELFEAKAYLVFALFNHGDWSPVITEGTPAIELGRKLKMTDAADYITALRYVGLALTRTGKAKDAEPLLRECLATSQRLLSAGSPVLASGEGALGECLTEEGKFGEAEPLIVSSYQTMQTQGEKSPLALTAAKRAVTLYEKMKKPSEAAKYKITVQDK
jgi:eukaryotic-like serine/threonine-protein kinase